MNEKGPFFLRIYIHVIRRSDGTGGQTAVDADEALDWLDDAFNKHGIYFVWDCVIHEIKDDVLFGTNDPNESSLWGDPNRHHEDGIDIYLFPDNPPPQATGNGKATPDGDPQTGFFVIGNYFLYPHEPRVKSHVMSHEMGHVLGLLHTDSEETNTGCTGNYPIGDTTGDCISDTPCDAGLIGNVSYPNCEYVGTVTQCDGAPHDPDIGNIMSLTNDECYLEFTEGQAQRMRNFIVWKEKISECLVQEVIDDDVVWDENSHPGGVIDLEGNVIIESGASLTIASEITVRFPANAVLIVKQDAELFLSGTLTSRPCTGSCINNCDGTWQGVQVWGDSEEHQHLVNGSRAQGRFVGSEGALVENARLAVQLWGPDDGSVAPPSGGLINCHKMTFQNNRQSVEFKHYENYSLLDPDQPIGYFGFFSLCDFVIDQNYPHQEAFYSFIYMVQVDGPRFRGCSFENHLVPANPQSISEFGIGLEAYNAGFQVEGYCQSALPCTEVTRSNFFGLGKGVLTVKTAEGNNPFYVYQSDFEDCFLGIENHGVSGGAMIDNNFELGHLPATSFTDVQLGIYLEGPINGMELQENDFEHVASVQTIHSIGISVASLGQFNNVIRRNDFTNLAVGNQAIGSCGFVQEGLTYACNQNTNTSNFDFLICDIPDQTDQVRGMQYGIDGQTGQIVATGNGFSNTTLADGDFLNEGDNADELEYHFYATAGTAETPDDYEGIANLVSDDENTRPAEWCLPPCRSRTELDAHKQAFFGFQADYYAARAAAKAAELAGDTLLAEQKRAEAALAKFRMDDRSWEILVHEQLDRTQYSLDTVYAWMSRLETYTAELDLAWALQMAGDSLAADSVRNNVSTKFDLSAEQLADYAAAKDLADIIGDTDPYALSSSQKGQLLSLSDSAFTYTGSRARNLLRYYGYVFPPEDCEHPGGLYPVHPPGKPNPYIPKSTLQAYPNPASEQVLFSLAEPLEEPAVLEVYDLRGRLVWQQPLADGEVKMIWPVTEMASGMYFYQLSSPAGRLDNGRIIIQK